MSKTKTFVTSFENDGPGPERRQLSGKTNKEAKAMKSAAKMERRLHSGGLWREEWDNCPPSTPECYYYVWNFNHNNYYCPEEGDIIRRGLYSKYELDDFLNDLRRKEYVDKNKEPSGWYYFITSWIMIGIGLILFSLWLWFKDNIRYFFLVLAIIAWVIAFILMLFAFAYCCRTGNRFRLKRSDMMPYVDSENRRVYHRGLNWRLSELGSYLALRTRYRGPVGGYRRRYMDDDDEEMYLVGRRPRTNVGATKTTTVTKTRELRGASDEVGASAVSDINNIEKQTGLASEVKVEAPSINLNESVEMPRIDMPSMPSIDQGSPSNSFLSGRSSGSKYSNSHVVQQ